MFQATNQFKYILTPKSAVPPFLLRLHDQHGYPLVNIQKTMEKSTIFNG